MSTKPEQGVTVAVTVSVWVAVASMVTVACAVTWMVAVTERVLVEVTVGVGAVMVAAVAEAQRQALLYAAALAHEDAYAGTLDGVMVTGPAAPSRRAGALLLLPAAVTVTVFV